MQFHHVKPHLNAVNIGAGRNLAIGRKQRKLAVPPAAFVKGFDQLAPGRALVVIDLAEIQHLRWTTLPPCKPRRLLRGAIMLRQKWSRSQRTLDTRLSN